MGIDERCQLAISLNVSEKRVRRWYEGQRQRIKQKGLPVELGEGVDQAIWISDNIIQNFVC